MEKVSSKTAYALLVVAILIWGFNFSLVKWVITRISPLAFNVLRFSIASVVILLILFVKEGWESMPISDFLKMFFLGAIGHAIYQVFFIRGLSLTTAGNSSLLIATSPIWTALLSASLKKEEVNLKTWTGIVLAFLGVFLVTLGSGNRLAFGGMKTIGDALTLAAAIALSSYTVLSRDLLDRYSPLRLTAITMAVGSAFLWLYGYDRVFAQDWGLLPVTGWAVLGYSALFAVVAGYLIWFTAVKSVGPTRAAIFNNMTPIIAFTVAFLLLGEPVSWLQIGGGVTVIGGISLTVRS